MSSLFSFLRSDTESPDEEPATERAFAEMAAVAAPEATSVEVLPLSITALSPGQALDDMLGVLRAFLPPSSPPLPDPNVSTVNVTELPLAIGNRRGTGQRGSFAVVALKGGRLDAVVRFQLWGNNPGEVDSAMDALHARLLAARDELWLSGFLRSKAEGSSSAEPVPNIDAWRKTADYRVLYEFHNEDSEGAQSLIARIPIDISSDTDGESTLVTDEMVRWDNEATPSLIIRGHFQVGRVSALSFVPGTSPSGAITLTRTFDGATVSPTSFTTLADFLAAVAGPNPIERHAQVTFALLTNFLAEFVPAGDPITLGDWDEDGIPDSYQTHELNFALAIQLPGVSDRLEIAYQGNTFDQVVVYMQATRG